MRKFILFLVIIWQSHQAFSETIQQSIQNTLPHAMVGIYVLDAESKKIIYQQNADKMFYAASTSKLFTAAAALYHLGPNYEYHTELLEYQGSIYIKFAGDPGFNVDNLNKLLNVLTSKQKYKNIIIDNTLFSPPDYSPATTYDDLGWYYAAPGTAVIINENKVAYEVNAQELNKSIKIKSKISNSPLKLTYQVTTVTKEDGKEHCSLKLTFNQNNDMHLNGCFVQNKTPQVIELAIPNPNLYAKQLIQNFLKINNIHFQGRIIEGKTPAAARLINQDISPPLMDVIKHMLVESDNLYAHSLTKLLGHSITREGTFKQGSYAIKKILAKHTPLNINLLELADGEGGRYNLTTPQQLVTLLDHLYQDAKMRPLFINALPKMGVSGTLKARMKNSPLTGKVMAKTGSMHDISTLAGYVYKNNSHTYIFAIMSNGINGQYAKAKELEEKILLILGQ